MSAPALAVKKGQGRAYRHPMTGEEVVSVTTVLNVLAKPALPKWSAKAAAEYAVGSWETLTTLEPAERVTLIKGAPWREAEAKADLGSAVHDAVDAWCTGREMPAWPAEVGAFMDQFVNFLQARRPEFLHNEATVWSHKHGYAGTFDFIATINGWLTLCDTKRLALDTPVPTPSGWSTMGEIRPGDVVFDELGLPCNVTSVSEVRTDEDCYRITWDDGATCTAGAGHPWLVGSHGADSQDVERIMSTLELDTRIARTNTKSQRQYWIKTAKGIQTERVQLPIDPYVLGAWLGDGNTRDGGFTTHRDDADHFIEQFEDAGYYHRGRRIDKRNSNCVSLNFPELRRRVIDEGLANNKHIPAAYLRASFAQRLALLQGLMDTDGSLNQSRQFRATFVQKRPEIVSGFLDLVRGLGLRVNEGHLLANGSRAFEFTPTLPVFRLPRKAGRIDVTDKQRALQRRRMIRSVERTLSVPTRCIAVDSPSHLYLCTEHYVPTHNTGKGTYPETALQLAALANADVILRADGTEETLPVAQQAAILHLRPQSWALIPVNLDGCFDGFLAALALWRWQAEVAPGCLGARLTEATSG